MGEQVIREEDIVRVAQQFREQKAALRTEIPIITTGEPKDTPSDPAVSQANFEQLRQEEPPLMSTDEGVGQEITPIRIANDPNAPVEPWWKKLKFW